MSQATGRNLLGSDSGEYLAFVSGVGLMSGKESGIRGPGPRAPWVLFGVSAIARHNIKITEYFLSHIILVFRSFLSHLRNHLPFTCSLASDCTHTISTLQATS